MNFSCARILTISSFSLDPGVSTCAWPARDALRIRVSRSAIGSVIALIRSPLPTTLRDPGDEAPERHLPETDPAQAELPEVPARAPADVAAVVPPHLELRGPAGLDYQAYLSHALRVPSSPSRPRPGRCGRAPLRSGCIPS